MDSNAYKIRYHVTSNQFCRIRHSIYMYKHSHNRVIITTFSHNVNIEPFLHFVRECLCEARAANGHYKYTIRKRPVGCTRYFIQQVYESGKILTSSL